MDKIRIVHDTQGRTLAVWFAAPETEHLCDETADGVVLMKDSQGRLIGFEFLHYPQEAALSGLSVEAIV